MTLFMIRHGQTDANLNGIYSGQSDVMLTDLGRQQARQIRPVLERYTFDRVYSSDLSRAMDTQKLALPGHEAITTPLLREISIGDLTGKSIAEVRNRYGNLKGNFAPFHGEDQDMLAARADEFLKLLEFNPCDQVAAFTHNGFMKAVLRCLLGKGVNTLPIANDNCNIAVFQFNGKSWSLLAWNLAGRI